MIGPRPSLLLAAAVLLGVPLGCTPDPTLETASAPTAPSVAEGSDPTGARSSDTPLRGEASRPGGPASHDGCAWAGTFLGRYGAEVPEVGGELVTVRLASDQRWFVESASGKVRGEWAREGAHLVITESLAIGAGTACGDAAGHYVFGMTNDCQTAALSVVEDACAVRAERLHQLVVERR